ncbi:hypothetical protein PHJA_002651900 [Phtheirospermum japonicum]|uniref:Uncharacterized protein n=1 Tax=Phtheirospermum japonicum TaxID=374723 RepID=A0A830CWY6_9LAMI|nr:hypothetical protein PHJA_002651900 [Phtheirospermum japonicum]
MDAIESPLSTSPSPPSSFSLQRHFYLAVDRLQFKMYSDLSEAHRAVVLDNFRQTTMRWNRFGKEEEADMEAEKEEERKSHVIVVTDACLPLLGSELPVCARILINYELPTKKVYFLKPDFCCTCSYVVS